MLVVAPLESRVRAVMEREGLAEREARRRIVAVEADRKAFLMKHFHAELADPIDFDLVVNTAVLGVEGACGADPGGHREPAGADRSTPRPRR